jgi:hypothetical protein
MRRGALVIAASCALAACGTVAPDAPDDASDVGDASSPIDSAMDSTIDTTIDSAIDSAIDGAIDSAIDSAIDAGRDDTIEGGADDDADVDGDECGGITYELDVQPIWTLSCADVGCHRPPSGPPPDLSDGASWSHIVGVRSKEMPSLFYVSPGDPTDSWLYQEITGAHGPGGVTMPPPATGAILSDSQKNTVLQWILCGAPP